ncbi:MAG: cell division topological specificity factor MinE [Zoogloeaceae bacterium]|jgi:cell division topological specificity factor|nr:cell division topological specificity factor MinE [Zoogloeaceae bacterium]
MQAQTLFSLLFGGKPKATAATAKERLAVLIASERNTRGGVDFMPALQRDLLEVISRYFPVDPEDIRINRESQGAGDLLEINIALPDSVNAA